MTNEEYLRAKGWVQDTWTSSDGRVWLDRNAQPAERQCACMTETAVRLQVERDTECAKFVSAYRGALASAEFDRVMGE